MNNIRIELLEQENLKDNEDIKKILELIIKKWCSYANLLKDKDILGDRKNDPRLYVLQLEKPEKLVDDNLNCDSITKTRIIYKYSRENIGPHEMRTLFYHSDENMKAIMKFMLEYNKYTYLNLIVHNLNGNKVMKAIDDFEQTII